MLNSSKRIDHNRMKGRKNEHIWCDGIVGVTAYAFRHDDVLCHLHTHNRAFPLLQTPYIVVAFTHDITRTKREDQ
jgi:hypothetical protein